MYVNLGDREKVCGTISRVPLSWAEFNSRGDAVVVYDNPSERIVGGVSKWHFQDDPVY